MKDGKRKNARLILHCLPELTTLRLVRRHCHRYVWHYTFPVLLLSTTCYCFYLFLVLFLRYLISFQVLSILLLFIIVYLAYFVCVYSVCFLFFGSGFSNAGTVRPSLLGERVGRRGGGEEGGAIEISILYCMKRRMWSLQGALARARRGGEGEKGRREAVFSRSWIASRSSSRISLFFSTLF